MPSERDSKIKVGLGVKFTVFTVLHKNIRKFALLHLTNYGGTMESTGRVTEIRREVTTAYGPGSSTVPQFQFDGDAGSYLGTNILAALLITVTIGFATPWAYCMRERWKAQHTIIEGRRLKFIGTGADLFGQWIIWELLCVVTIGIYSFWVGPNLMKWKWKYTRYE